VLAGEPSPEPFVIVVHPRNPIESTGGEFLADAFLKKTTRWGSGETIQPVDLHPGSPVRKVFSETVLKRSISAVRRYWQQRIFSGRDLPPPELASEQAVIDYVVRNPGAVGYVSGAAQVGGAKVVRLR